MVPVKLGAIAMDCDDPEALAEFWAGLLDGEVTYRSETFAAVRAGEQWLTAHAVENYRPPTWPSDEVPKQMHLDLAVTDLAEAAAYALERGALRAESQPEHGRFIVFYDPAGHPFCLTTMIP